jgi:hypothetical protein
VRYREIMKENTETVPVLYHGTTPESAKAMCTNGWSPRPGHSGGNGGQGRYLYLSTGREDAQWFSNEIGEDTVIEVHNIPKSYLRVDPEDGIGDSVDDEMNNAHGLPGKLILVQPLPASHFSMGPNAA